MDPVTGVIGLIGAVIGASKGVLMMLERQAEVKRTEYTAMSDLRIAVDQLKGDANVYETLLRTMITVEGDNRAAIKLCNSMDGKDALGRLSVALEAARLLLERNQAIPTEYESRNDIKLERPKRPPIKELIASFLKANFTMGDDTLHEVEDTTRDIGVCRGNCEREFKLVWHLYVIYQQPPTRQSTIEYHRRSQELIELALDDVLQAFLRKPFSTSPEGTDRILYTRLTELNRNNECAKRHEAQMRDVGMKWVHDVIDHQPMVNPSGKVTTQVQALGQLQTMLFELLWTNTVEQLKRHGTGWAAMDPRGAHSEAADKEQSEFQKDLLDLEKTLQEAILRAKKQRFAIAFCGMVKAGKSLFLNALIGESILPSDELPSTAWPCRLRHVPGQTTPELTFDIEPFLGGLAALQKAQYGAILEAYQPPEEDSYEDMFDEMAEPSAEEVRIKELHAKWVDLHAATRKNLLEFEKSSFRLRRRATGHSDVKKLLSQLNDIVRLCHRFGLPFKMDDVEWPLLSVEFNSLRGHQMDGVYEFIDLPGIGESFEAFDFENLVRLVAKDSNAIVPIISFKELARSDWKKLPDIVQSGFGNRASVVVCTHLDQIHGENLTEQIAAVGKVFWPREVHTAASRIIPCSSLMGLSARALLDLTAAHPKPRFRDFWDERRTSVTHSCAERILGTGEPEQHYKTMNASVWHNKLKMELEKSGLPDAIKKLTREMVDQAKQRAFMAEGEGVCKQLRKMNSAQERKLLEARRSRNEFEAAKREYDRARYKFSQLIDSWNVNEYQQVNTYRAKLSKGLASLSKRAEGYIHSSIESTLNEWSLGSIKKQTVDEDEVIGKGPESARTKERGGVTVLVVRSPAHAEEFLRLSQRALQTSLNKEKQDFVVSVRKLAEEARSKRFQALKDEINKLDPQLQPELRQEIKEDLDNQSVDIRQVAFQHIKNQIKTVKTRHNASTAFRAIEERLARPLLGQKEEGQLDDGEKTALQALDDLGFMLRAPITAIATIPFVFGLPIWPWMVHSQSFHLSMDFLTTQYKQLIVDPWVRSLNEDAEKSLVGTISASSQVAKTAVENALQREALRYQRESDLKNSPGKGGMVQHMVALSSSLWAADSALLTIQQMLKESRP